MYGMYGLDLQKTILSDTTIILRKENRSADNKILGRKLQKH